MDDGFLHQFREKPGEEFALRLHKELTQKENVPVKGRVVPVIVAILIILIAFASTVVFVPEARAKLIDVIEKIGGTSFLMTNDYPGDGKGTTIPSQEMSLSEAQSILPFQLPTWTPEGFRLQPTVDLISFDSPVIFVTWIKMGGSGNIQMNVEGGTFTWVVGPDSVERVEINGKEAALWYGGWNWDTKQWEAEIPNMTLSWEQDGLAYHLSVAKDQVSLETLLQIAGSMP
ncbi:MAG: hypothetical protein A2Z14_04965 [Chloroflexi bacterium RBG_16_48_8]|nr:MAG: hypothetical protein A2Z14_04965 [Chloroflexi bacterium RBG_16_48_8]